MDHIDHRHRRPDLDHDRHPFDRQHMNPKLPHPRCPSRPPRPDRMPAEDPSGYTLMVAGRRTGKTSFLRLLLDTSNLSSSVTRDQLASVAKFVQGCSGHTAHVRSVSIDIDLAPDEADEEAPLKLTLIDTPSLDFEDDSAFQRALQEILRHVEARLGESLEDVSAAPLLGAHIALTHPPASRPQERKAHTGDQLVHLYVPFLFRSGSVWTCSTPPALRYTRRGGVCRALPRAHRSRRRPLIASANTGV